MEQSNQPERRRHGVLVGELICSRILFEMILGTSVRLVYRFQKNVGLNLTLGSIVFIIATTTVHILQHLLAPGFMKGFFGKHWVISWDIMKSMLLPTMCQCAALMLKQFIVRDDGVGYAEMLGEIGVPIQCYLQYYLHGETLGLWGILSCTASGLCFLMVLGACSLKAVLWTTIASILACLRCTLIVATNKKKNTSPDLNLVMQSVITIPLYLTCAVWTVNFTNSWDTLEASLTKTLTSYAFLSYMFTAWLSNLIVFRLFSIASPYTFQISSQMKGICLAAWDLFYLDYASVHMLTGVLNFVCTILIIPVVQFFGGTCDITGLMDHLAELQEVLQWRNNRLSSIGVIGFGFKVASSCFYLLEKRSTYPIVEDDKIIAHIEPSDGSSKDEES